MIKIKYLFLAALLACNAKPVVDNKTSEPFTYKRSPEAQRRSDSIFLMIEYMGIRDSFNLAAITAYLKNEKRKGERLEDSADLYNNRLKSFNQSN